MDWLKELLKNKPLVGLVPAAGMGVLTFVGHLLIALGDGQLDGNEVHQLMSSASGLETAVLVLVILALKKGKDEK